MDGTRHENGSSWSPADGEASCVECTCKDGVSHCSEKSDCRVGDVNEECSYKGKVAISGEKWVDGCMECECMVSSISNIGRPTYCP